MKPPLPCALDHTQTRSVNAPTVAHGRPLVNHAHIFIPKYIMQHDKHTFPTSYKNTVILRTVHTMLGLRITYMIPYVSYLTSGARNPRLSITPIVPRGTDGAILPCGTHLSRYTSPTGFPRFSLGRRSLSTIVRTLPKLAYINQWQLSVKHFRKIIIVNSAPAIGSYFILACM